MSSRDAKADGVRIAFSKEGKIVFFPPCTFCGVEVFSYNYLPGHHYACPGCRPHKRILLSTGLFPRKRDKE